MATTVANAEVVVKLPNPEAVARIVHTLRPFSADIQRLTLAAVEATLFPKCIGFRDGTPVAFEGVEPKQNDSPDPWEVSIRDYLSDRKEATFSEIAKHLGIGLTQMDKNRIYAIVRNLGGWQCGRNTYSAQSSFWRVGGKS